MDFQTKLAALTIGDVLSNDQLHRTFNVSTQGGMRKSNLNHCLVLIAKENGNLYPDKWDGDTLLYTGMGKVGDQSFYDRQNKTLFEADQSDVQIFLFVQTKPNRYTYYGPVRLAKQPYYAQAADEQNQMRRVAMFPLVPTGNLDQIHRINQRTVRDSRTQQTNQLRKRSVRQLATTLNAQPPAANRLVSKRIVAKSVVEPNPIVQTLAKKLANGHCQLCGQPAPFEYEQQPYLKVHYLTALDNGGSDALANAVALCPNCYQKMQLLNPPADREQLTHVATNLAAEYNQNND
ncbi:HNH endonuclease [Lactobacillaceae bacterium Melli_B3]